MSDLGLIVDESFPSGVGDDGVVSYGPILEPEHIPGIDPATGQPDGRFDGTVTVAVTMQRTPEVRPTPNPNGSHLVEAVRSSDLMIARDLGVGLADLAEDERLRTQAAELRRSLDERYR